MPQRALLGLIGFIVAVCSLRAQVTETPVTIEPGRFFLRMDAVTVGVNRDKAERTRFTALGLASSILSLGLTQNTDVQVGAQFFVRETFQFGGGARESRSGWGDTTLRMKWRFWNDAALGASAAAIPYVKIPSKTTGVGNNRVEGGFIVPWSMKLALGTEVGAMGQWELKRNDANNGYDSRWYASGFVRQALVAGFGAYGEATVEATSASSSSFIGGAGGGVTWDFSKFLQFDYGLSRGLGGRATDWVNVLRLRWNF